MINEGETMTKLEPCPKCGAKHNPPYPYNVDIRLNECMTMRGYRRANCRACGWATEAYLTDEECVAAWNRRTSPAPTASPEPAASDQGLLQQAREWIEAIDIRYGPSHYSLASLLARVRGQETERCAKVCDGIADEVTAINVSSYSPTDRVSVSGRIDGARACAAAIRGQP